MLHPFLQRLADRAGGQIGGFGPGESHMDAYRRAFLSRNPMTTGDGRQFRAIRHGHKFSIITRRCEHCGIDDRDYIFHSDPMDAPLCAVTFPQSGGCSLNQWNAGLAAMKERGKTGFLSMVPVRSYADGGTMNPAIVNMNGPSLRWREEPRPAPESDPLPDPARPKRVILHEK